MRTSNPRQTSDDDDFYIESTPRTLKIEIKHHVKDSKMKFLYLKLPHKSCQTFCYFLISLSIKDRFQLVLYPTIRTTDHAQSRVNKPS